MPPIECRKCGRSLTTREVAPGGPTNICARCLLDDGLKAIRLYVEEQTASGRHLRLPDRDALQDLLPEFELIRLLGKGGGGAVYLARQLRLDRPVALKVLRPLSGSLLSEAALQAEARTLAKLNHPHIATIFDCDEVGDLFYFVMEYVEGRSLDELLESGQLRNEQSLAFIPRICDALAYAHGRGVVHCDLKPSNLLLDTRGAVKLIDFGVARFISAAGRDSADSTQEVVVGTPRYMSPEQRSDPNAIDGRSDLYSLGLVIHEFLTGELPEQGSAAKLRPVDGRLADLVESCLAPDPKERIGSAQELKDQLETFLHSHSGSPWRSLHSANCTLLTTSWSESPTVREQLGTTKFSAALRRHEDLINQSLRATGQGILVHHYGDGFLVRFDCPEHTVAAALRFQLVLSAEWESEHRMWPSMGIAQGSVLEIEHPERSPVPGIIGDAVEVSQQLAAAAQPGQILMTKSVFDAGRSAIDASDFTSSRAGEAIPSGGIQWLAHGEREDPQQRGPLDLYEACWEKLAPLVRPDHLADRPRRQRSRQEDGFDWRPALGLTIPGRKDWRLTKRLGEGGFGEVWLADEGTTNRKRVFKFCFDHQRLQSLKREFTIARLFRSALSGRTDIVDLYDVNLDSPPYYIESEYCEEGNLRQWAEHQGGLQDIPLETRLHLIILIARALAAAHSVGVVHKDLKPSNVFIFEENGSPHPRLADFGIGVLWDESTLDEAGVTRLGFTKSPSSGGTSSEATGTLLYCAPEYLLGHPPTIQGDLYALGVLLYQLVIGDFDQPLATGWNDRVTDPLLRADIEECVQVEPGKRFRSAEELAERLEELEARHARRIAAAERKRKRARRRRLITAGVIAASLILTGLLVAATYQGRMARLADQKNLQLEEALYQSRLDAARAQLQTGSPGQRHQTLETIKQAARIRSTDEGRDLAIAALSLVDVREAASFPATGFRAMFPDFARISYSLPDGAISIRDRFTQRELDRLPGRGGRRAKFHKITSKADYLAANYELGPNTGRIDVWDLRHKKVILTIPDASIHLGFDFAPNGKQIAAFHNNHSLVVYRLPEGDEVRSISLSYPTDRIVFDSTGTRIAVTDRSKSRVLVYDLAADGQKPLVLTHPTGVRGIDWSPDGRLLATSGINHHSYVWRLASPAILCDLFGHTAEIDFIGFHPSGRTIATSSWDGSTRLWNPRTGEQLLRLRGQRPVWSHDGRYLKLSDGKSIKLLEVTPDDEFRSLFTTTKSGNSNISGVSFSHAGHLLASGSTDGLRLWSPLTGDLLAHARVPSIGALHFEPGDRALITTGRAGALRWPIRSNSGHLLVGPPDTLSDVKSYRFSGLSADGTFLAAAPAKGMVHLYDLTTRRLVWENKGHPGCNGAVLDPTGTWVAGTSFRGTGVRVWNTRDRQPPTNLIPYANKSAWASFSPDGRLLATSSRDGLTVWRTGRWDQVFELRNDSPQTNIAPALAFSNDSKWLVWSGHGDRIALFHCHPLREVASLSTPARALYPDGFLAFHQNGLVAFAQDKAHQIFLWDLARIRQRLAEWNLDWDAEPFPPVKDRPPSPTRVQILSAERE